MEQQADICTRFEVLLEALRRDCAASEDLARRLDELLDAGQTLIDAYDVLEATLTAREEQIAIQSELLRAVSLPIIQIRPDALCAPIIGEIDVDRAAQLTGDLLRSAVERRVRLAVIDLTGARMSDASAATYLLDVIRALGLVGVRGVVTGMSPETARALAELPDGLGAVSCHATVASALAAYQNGRRATATR
jgi:anti-anti-sigma regulatory factor